MRGPGCDAQLRIHSLFNAAEAESSCLVPQTRTDQQLLRTLVRKGQVVSPVKGIYARKPYWIALDEEGRAHHILRGLACKHPSWVFCSYSAAFLHGLDVPRYCLRPVRVVVTRRAKAASGKVRSRYRNMRDEIVRVDGIRVTEIWQTVLEVLLEATFPAGLAVADSALRKLSASSEQLIEYVRAQGKNRRGVARARIISQHADGAAENGGESRARAFFISWGFQLPELQVELDDPTALGKTFRVDFLWRLPDGRCIIGEFDGRGKYEDLDKLGGKSSVDAMMDERQRESRLTLLGYPLIRFTYDDLLHPHRLANLLRVAGVPQDPEAKRAWESAWAAAAPRKGRTQRSGLSNRGHR